MREICRYDGNINSKFPRGYLPVKSGELGIPEDPCFIMWSYGKLDNKD